MACLFQMRVGIIDMVTHGYNKGTYAQYMTMARSLCMSKKPLVHNSKFKININFNTLPFMITLTRMWQSLSEYSPSLIMQCGVVWVHLSSRRPR